jgi:HAD superfamily hydrolase (TIGR01509 family)
MSGIALHIFDCDGVLVDSEVLVTRIESELLSAVGITLSPEEIAATFVGLSDAEMHRRIEEQWQIRLPSDFAMRKSARIDAAFEVDLTPVPGVPELLADLGGARCVASSSALPRIRQSLAATGLAPFFEPHLFSASMVANGKPAPDLFRHAARSMDVAPSACAVIEDSPHGVAAGRAAGMYVIGFTGGGHCGPGLADELATAGAHEVAADAGELLGALTRTDG